MSDTISIDATDRYERLRMIPWWDQELLRRSKVMVVGAGALGNEIIKNLALLGIGSILIVDFDNIELSNLSRSVLYRVQDSGAPKAHAAAEAARKLNPDCRVYSINADVTRHVGLGLFRWADVVICGLDNREARLAVNKACWKVNRPWVDGATESLQGVARAFVPPDGVCYECTLSEQDHAIMAARDSCGFLAREAVRHGGAPTTPTTSAVIAGIEVQEAVKLLHGQTGLSNLAGKGLFFDGGSYDCFTIDYTRRDDCLSHETYEHVVESELESASAGLDDVIREAGKHLGSEDVIIDLPSEMVTGLRCSDCSAETQFYRLLHSVSAQDAACPRCARERVPDVVTECRRGTAFGSLSLAELGFAIMDIVPVRAGEHEVQIEISGDLGKVFGERQ